MLDPWLAKRRISFFQSLHFARWFVKVKPFASFALWFLCLSARLHVAWSKKLFWFEDEPNGRSGQTWSISSWQCYHAMAFLCFLLHSMLISVSTHPSPPPNTSWQSHRCLWWWKSHWLQCPKSSGSSPEKLHFSAMWYDVVLLMPLKKLHHVGCLKLQPLQFSEGGVTVDAWTA